MQFRVPATHRIITSAKEAAEKFSSEQKRLKEAGTTQEAIRQRLGHPNNHVVNRWLGIYLAELPEPTQTETRKAVEAWGKD